MSIRKAIGAVKDHTSIRMAKSSSYMAPELKVAIVKATSHHEIPADEKYIRLIINLVSPRNGYVHACVAAAALSKRLRKTRDWVVAIKALLLVHRLLDEGEVLFQHEIMNVGKKGMRVLDMSDFRDEAHGNSWDHSKFVKTYAMFLDQKLELMMFESSLNGNGGGDMGREESWSSLVVKGKNYENAGKKRETRMRRTKSFRDVKSEVAAKGDRRVVTPFKEMKLEMIFAKMGILERFLNTVLACRPCGMAKNCRLVLIAMYPIVKESFQLYKDIREGLDILLDKFSDMEYPYRLKTFHTYAAAAKQIDELIIFYNWCKDVGVSRTSEIPNVQRITDQLLGSLKDLLTNKAKGQTSHETREASPASLQEEPVLAVETLPAPEFKVSPPPTDQLSEPEPLLLQYTGNLLNLMDDGVTANDEGDKFALALFADPPVDGNSQLQALLSDSQSLSDDISSWQNPADEDGQADWELALLESASNLSIQPNATGGVLDPIFLNGLYADGTNHSTTCALTGGSIEIDNQNPFAASMDIQLPSYVQVSDMEKKQQLHTQEQLMWQSYASQGMQQPASFARQGFYRQPFPQMMPNGMMPPGGYYNTQ